jgi:hypothetical protein
VVGAAIAVIAGIAFSIFSAGMGAPGIFPLFGILFVVFGVFTAANGLNKASSHRTAERVYKKRRLDLLSEMRRVQGQGPIASSPGRVRRPRRPSPR